MKFFASILLALSLFVGTVQSQIVRIKSKMEDKAGLSTGFFVDATTIVATDHSVSMGETVTLHTVAKAEDGTIYLKEFGKAKVVYESTGSTLGQTDDVAILKLETPAEVKNPLFLSPLGRCEGVICMVPSFPAGSPSVLSVIGHANRQTSMGDTFDFRVLSQSPLCIGGCSGGPAQSIEMGGHVIGMVSRQHSGGTAAVCVPSYVIRKHLELYRGNLESIQFPTPEKLFKEEPFLKKNPE